MKNPITISKEIAKGMFKEVLTDKDMAIKDRAEIKKQRMREERAEIRRMVSVANKRIRRLEEKGLTDTPAYQGYLDRGGKPFSVKGKDYNQLQKEKSRIKGFLEAKTSTVRGINATLKDMAEATGMKYKTVSELQVKSKKFFELATKAEQYLKMIDSTATAIGYQKIWEAINQYTKAQQIDLANARLDVEGLLDQVSSLILEKEDEENERDFESEWFHL